MARPMKPLVRSGGYYPSNRWTPLVYAGGYTTANGGGEPEPPPIEKTITGNPIHITDALAKPVQALSIALEPVQDLHGYSYPWPAGGGVNLLDPAKCSAVGPGGAYGLTVTHDQATAIWTISGTPTSQNASLGFNFCTYSDFSLSGKGYQVQAFPISGTPIKNIYGFRNEAENKIAIVIDTVANPTVNMTFKVSVAATAQTAWSPYSNLCPISGWTGANVYHSGADTSDATTYSITFPSEAGTVYGGTLDVTTGKLTVDRAMVDLGTLTWYAATAQRFTRFRAPVIGIKQIDSPNVLGAIVCSSYATKTANQTYTGSLGISLQQNANDVYIYDPQKEAFSAADFKSAMSGVQLVYKLATPQTYQLTPTEVATLLGENNIWSDADNITMTYFADGNASDEEALGILLGNRYVNNHGADEPTDSEALGILLGGNER